MISILIVLFFALYNTIVSIRALADTLINGVGENTSRIAKLICYVVCCGTWTWFYYLTHK